MFKKEINHVPKFVRQAYSERTKKTFMGNVVLLHTMNYPKKTRFQSVPIAALCLYNIQRKNLIFKNSLCTTWESLV